MIEDGPSLIRQIAELKEMPLDALRERYREVFGEEPTIANKDHLWKRIAYRLQEIKHGGLSPEARARLEEMMPVAPEMCLRSRTRRKTRAGQAAAAGTAPGPPRDPRLPAPGTVLTRRYNGVEYRVTVLDAGFEYAGRTYRSLSAVAREITGTAWNGYGFFALQRRKTGGRRLETGGAR